MLTVANVQTGADSLVSATPKQDSIDSFNLALSQQSQVVPQQNTIPFPSPSPSGTVDLSPPPEDANSLVDLIQKAFAGIPEGTAGVIGTRINFVPDEILQQLPRHIKDRIAGLAGTSTAIAFIFPPNSVELLQDGGPIKGLIDILLNTTLWIGIVPPSGPAFPSGNRNPPSLSDPFRFPGADAAYVMTARLNEGDIRRGVTVDFRAGWAYLNDIRPQNILQGQNPIVPDKADPDTWLFLNAGVTGSLGSVEELPQAFVDGFEEIANGLSISANASGTPQFEFNAAGGGVVTAGALARIPTSERWTNGLGDWLVRAGSASSATGVGAAWGAILAAVGLAFKQSTGLYVGPGWSVSRLTLDTAGELTYYSPNNRYSGNILDIPAVGTNIGAALIRPINQDLATSIDNLASPTRTTLAQIIDAPTDLRDGEERANPTRLNLYWDEYLDSLPTSAPGVDLLTIADKLVTAYNNPNATEVEKANISHLYFQTDLEPARLIFQNMLLNPATDKLIFPGNINYGQDGVLGIEDLPALFDFAKQQWGNASGDTNNYSSRLGRLARALYDAGWSELFNGNGLKDATIVPDLASAISAVENGIGRPAQENPLTDRVLPLYRFDPAQASNPDGVLVAIGDLDGLFTGPSDGAAPLLVPSPALSAAYRGTNESTGDLTTIAFRGQTTGFDVDFSNPDTQAALLDVEVVGLTDNDDVIRGDYTGKTVLGLGGNDTITAVNGGTVYADYSAAYVDTYGPVQGLDPNNLPEGSDTIEVGNVATGFIDAGGGDDRVSINATASVAADGTTTINFPAGPGADGTPGLTLDGGAGDGDTLVIRITNPVPYEPIFSAANLPANITNFENVELVYDVGLLPSELTGIGGVPAENTAPQLFTTDTAQMVDVILGNGARPGETGSVYLDISGPSMFGGAMASLTANSESGSPGVISTTMADLTIGQETSFTFVTEAARRTGANPQTSDAPNGQLRVLVDGAELATIDVGAEWSEHTLSFTPTAASATITFEAIGDNETTPSTLAFDEQAYLAANPDVAAAVAEAADYETQATQAEAAIPGLTAARDAAAAQIVSLQTALDQANAALITAQTNANIANWNEQINLIAENTAKDVARTAYQPLIAGLESAVKALADIAAGTANAALGAAQAAVVAAQNALDGAQPVLTAAQSALDSGVANATALRATADGYGFSSGFDHFVRYGASEGRSTSGAGIFPPIYNESAYLAANPDVITAVALGSFQSGFDHFLKYGAAEGRNGGGTEPLSLYYNEGFYLTNNPDVANAVSGGAFISGFEHFVRFGAGAGRLGLDPDLDVIVVDTPSLALQNKQVIGDGVDTGERQKIADLRRTDPSLTQAATFTVSGEDANLVEIDGSEIYLKAGVSLNAATNPTIDIIVEATEPGLNVINGEEGIDARRAFSFNVIAGQTFIAPDVPIPDNGNTGGGGTGGGGTGGGGIGGGGGGIGGGGGGIGGGGGGIGGGGSVGGPGPVYTPPLPPGDDIYRQRSLAIEPLQLPSGNFVFVWQQSPTAGGNTKYFGLVMQPDGTPAGGASAAPFEIFAGQTNVNNTSYDKLTVTATDDGGFVVSGIYNDYNRDANAPGGGSDVIHAQFYNAGGVVQGDLITVNPSDTGNEYDLTAVTAPGGGVGLIWQTFNDDGAIRGRILKSPTDTGEEFEVFANTNPSDDWDEDIIDVDVIDDQIFVVGQVGAGGYGYLPEGVDQLIDFANDLGVPADGASPVQRVFAGQMISTTGTPIQNQPTAITIPAPYSTAVEIRPDGSVVMAELQDSRTYDEADGILIKFYSPNGTLISEGQADVSGNVDYNTLRLTRLENGDVALSWRQNAPSGSSENLNGVFTQTFNIPGSTGGEITSGTATRVGLDSHNPGDFSNPIALANGAYAIPYTVLNDGNYANGTTLFVQNVAADGTLGDLIVAGDASNVAYGDVVAGKLETGGLATAFTMGFTQVQDEDAAVTVLERQNV